MWGFGYAVAIGAVFAGFANFVYEGASYMDRFTKKPKGILYIVEFLVAAAVFTLYMVFPVSERTGEIMFYVISGVAIFVGIMEFLLRFFRKRRRTDRDNVPFGAYVMVPLVLVLTWVASSATGFPIGNTAHFGGFVAGLAYGFYLRKKYKRKTAMISKMFSQ